MKWTGQGVSFFLWAVGRGGGAAIGMLVVKLWYLHRVAHQAGSGFDLSVYSVFALLDTALALMLGLILWQSYRQKLAAPLEQIAARLRQTRGHGDQANQTGGTPSGGDVQDLAQVAETLLTRVHSLIAQVQEVGHSMLDASQAAFSTSTHQSALLTEQVSASNEMASALQALVQTAQQISADGQAVVGVARRTLELAEQGQRAVLNVGQSMADIRQAFQRNADTILALGRHSEHINDVVKTIDRMIADTKLIAFNATIEAARAREEGRGFGVVALEIQRLAEEVFESTEDIQEVIQEIQGASLRLVSGTEEEMKTVSQGTRLAEEAGEALSQIVAMVTLTTDSAQRIAAVTQQQTTASEHVWQAVETANRATRRFAQETKQVAATAAELSVLAEGLGRMLAGFRGE